MTGFLLLLCLCRPCLEFLLKARPGISLGNVSTRVYMCLVFDELAVRTLEVSFLFFRPVRDMPFFFVRLGNFQRDRLSFLSSSHCGHRVMTIKFLGTSICFPPPCCSLPISFENLSLFFRRVLFSVDSCFSREFSPHRFSFLIPSSEAGHFHLAY